MSDKTTSNRDARKRGAGNGKRRPGGRNGRGRWGSEAYKQKVDERIFGRRDENARRKMEERLRKAQGAPADLLRIFREYEREHGVPDDLLLLLLLLDMNDDREVMKVIAALRDTAERAGPERRSLLRKRLQNFEMSTSSDVLGNAAAELLDRL